MREKQFFTQSILSSVEIDTFEHVKRDKYEKNENFDRGKSVLEHISD